MTLRLDAQLICWDCCIILAAFLAMVGPSLKQGLACRKEVQSDRLSQASNKVGTQMVGAIR